MPALGLGLGLPLSSARPAYDVDAASFFSRAAITNSAQQFAVDRLVKDLKAALIWTKIVTLYPYVGGTAGSHAQNLKSASFTITWAGGVTHNANGVTGNGTTGYGDTGLIQSATSSNGGVSTYTRTVPIVEINQWALAVDDGTNFYGLNHDTIAAENQTYGFWGSPTSVARRLSQPSAGFYSVNRTAVNLFTIYRNGVSAGTDANVITPSSVAFNYYVLARNASNTPVFFTGENSALMAIHAGLTGPESLAFYTAVQAYQTRLGRNV